MLGEQYEAARKLVEDAKEGLRVAQCDLDQAEVQHRSACNEVKRAEAELREVELEVAGNLDELETAKIAALICGSDDCQTAVRRKVSWLRYEAALRLLRDAKEGLGLAQDHLDRAEGKHRYSRMNVEQAETALLEIELDVVRNFQIAGLQLLQEAAHAKERSLGMEEHKTASTARIRTISDQLATVALPKQGGRSRSPPRRRTRLVGPAADAMEDQP